MNSQDFMWLAIGIAALAAAAGIVLVCVRLAGFLGSAERTLGNVDRELGSLDGPLTKTLGHVSGVAESVDGMVAKVNRIADAAEKAAVAVAKTADAAQAAVTPTVANLIGVVAGVSKGAKTFFRSRGRNGSGGND